MIHNVNESLVERNILVPIESVTRYPGNPRKSNVTALAESLRLNTQYRPIVVQESTGHILVGNHTHEAAESLGWTHVAAEVIDVTDEKAREIVLFDNRAGDDSSYDDQALYALLAGHVDDGFDLVATGYTVADVEVLAQVTGALAADAASFLDDIDEDGAATAASVPPPDSGTAALTFALAPADKDVVVAKLRAVQREEDVDTMAAALLILCRD